MLTPIEAEVLANVTEDLCTLAELQDRLALRDLARPTHTEAALLWLERRGLVERWSDTLYRPTSAGVVELGKHRRRAPLVRMILAGAA